MTERQTYPERRILHIASQDTWRGGEQQVSYLVDELRHYHCLQWVLCSEGNAMEIYCQQNGIPNYSYKKGFSRHLRNRKLLNDICERHAIDVIHVHDSVSHTLAYMSALYGNQSAIIVSRRVDFNVCNNRFSKRKYNNNSIVKYICVSEKIRDILGQCVTDHSKLEVVHSGVDLSRFEGKTQTGILRKDFQISESELLIGNVAALADHKDYYTFVNTAEVLTRQGINARFLIIGEGPLEDELKKYISSKNLSNKILFTGFRNDIPDILPELDVFLFTSKTEGLGTSILDAMACGVPVVSTNAGGIPEIVTHNENGLLADVGDSEQLSAAIIRLTRDTEFKKQIVINARHQLLNKFTKEEMARKTYLIYREVYYSQG
ncbi:glycosyltransferase family 4 protein [Bacteroidota bacterium]